MNRYLSIFFLILVFACTEKKSAAHSEQELAVDQEMIVPEFQKLLDSSGVNGSILIYDAQQKLFYSNDYDWAKTGRLPASTFKIANSIIGLETRVIESDSSLFKWDGEPRSFKSWEQDLILSNAFHYSCVPCYQEVARGIGAVRMNEYLSKLAYGKMQVDEDNIDVFWLEGASKISQFEQIAFLRRYYENELPISERTTNIMRRMMVIEERGNQKLSGKTGWSKRNDDNNGWFVGYVETPDNVYYFATNVEPKSTTETDQFLSARKEATLLALDLVREK